MPAGYRPYAHSPADFVGSGEAGGPLIIGSGTLTVWTAETGGTQVTDLLDASELPVTAVETDDFGNFRFFAPDDLGELWLDNGTTTRYVTQPTDLGSRVLAVETSVDAAVTDSAAALTTANDTAIRLDEMGLVPKVTFGPGPMPASAQFPHVHFQLAGVDVVDPGGGGGGGGVQITDPFDGTAASLGANWTETTNADFEKISGQVAPSTASTGMARHVTIPTSETSQFAQIKYAASPAGVSVFVGPAVDVPPLGASTALMGSCYVLLISGTTMSSFTIRKKAANASTLTTLGSAVTQTVTPGDVLKLARQGNELIGYLNGTEILRRDVGLAPLDETGVSRGVGFWATGNASIRLDDFAGGDL